MEKPNQNPDSQTEKKPRIKIYLDPSNLGAEVDDSVAEQLPTVEMQLDIITGLEPDKKMELPESSAKEQEMIELLKNPEGSLRPILVRVYGDGYQVIDGHHRYHAYKKAKRKTIPVKIVPEEEIEIIG